MGGVYNKITDLIIRDPVNSGFKAKVNDSGFMFITTPPPDAPEGTTPVVEVALDGVGGNSLIDTIFLIPDTKILTVQRFNCGSEDMDNSSKCVLYYASNGAIDGTEEILSHAYLNGSNFVEALDRHFTGDGAAAIIMRRQRLDAQVREIFAKWVGFHTNE